MHEMRPFKEILEPLKIQLLDVKVVPVGVSGL